MSYLYVSPFVVCKGGWVVVFLLARRKTSATCFVWGFGKIGDGLIWIDSTGFEEGKGFFSFSEGCFIGMRTPYPVPTKNSTQQRSNHGGFEFLMKNG